MFMWVRKWNIQVYDVKYLPKAIQNYHDNNFHFSILVFQSISNITIVCKTLDNINSWQESDILVKIRIWTKFISWRRLQMMVTPIRPFCVQNEKCNMYLDSTFEPSLLIFFVEKIMAHFSERHFSISLLVRLSLS